MTPTNTAQQLMEDNQGLVRSLAWKIQRNLPRHVELDDLVGFGHVGLAEAARDFDPRRGRAFSTYAYYRIRGAIYDGLAKMSWHSRSHYRSIRRQQLADEVLRLEDDADDAELGGLEGHAQWLNRTASTLAVIYLAAGADEESEASSLQLADPSATAPPVALMGRETCAKLRELIDALPAEPRSLIQSVYFEGLTLQEAGKRLGISKAWASRLHAKTLGQLARSLRLIGMQE